MARTPEFKAIRPAGVPRALLRLAIALLLGASALILILVLALETPWGVRTVARSALDLANPWPGSTLSVAGARGGFLTGLTLFGFDLRQADGPLQAHVDTLKVQYRLNELLGSPFRLRHISLAGVQVVTSRGESGFDLVTPFRKPPTVQTSPAPPKKAGKRTVIGAIQVQRASVELRFRLSRQDSLVRVTDLEVALRDLTLGGGATRLALDTLAATVTLPASPEAQFRVTAAGALTGDRLTVTTLEVDGGKTHVSGAGVLDVANRDRFDTTRVSFHAHPIASDDLARWLPRAPKFGEMTVDLEAQGEGPALVLDAALRQDQGGAITLKARGIPSLEGPIEFGAHAKARAFTLERGADLWILDGAIDADLRGPGREHISGPVQVSLNGTRIGAMRLTVARLSALTNDGETSLHGEVKSPEFQASLSGTARPFDARPSYDVSASLDETARPPDARGRRPWFAGQLAGRLKGEGVSTRDATADLHLAWNPGTEPNGGALLEDGHVDASLDQGVAHWVVDAGLARGRLSATGMVAFDSTLTYSVLDGMVRDLHFAELADDTVSSRLNAQFRIQGRGTSPGNARIQMSVTSFGLEYGAHRFTDGTLDVDVADDRASLIASGKLDQSAITAHGTLAPLSPPAREATLNLTFRDLDLSKVFTNPLYTSNLAGRMETSVRSRDLRAALAETQAQRRPTSDLHAEWRLALGASTWRGRTISSLGLSGACDGGQATLDGSFASGLGTGLFRVRGRPFDPVPSVTVRTLQVDSLDLGNLLGLGPRPTRIQGSLSGTAAGRELASLDARAELDLSGSTVYGTRFDRLIGDARLQKGSLTSRLEAHRESAGALLSLAGRPFADPMTLELQGNVEGDSLRSWFGHDTLAASTSLAFQLAGSLPRGAGLDRVSAKGHFEGNASAGGARLDTLAAVFELERGCLRIPTLDISGNVVTLHGSGRILLPRSSGPETTDFTLTGATRDLTPLRLILGRRLLTAEATRFRFSAIGPPSATHLALDLSSTHPHIDQIWADSVALNATGTLKDTTCTDLEAELNARSLVVWPLIPGQVTAHARWDGHELAVEAGSRAQGGHTRDVAFRWEPGPRQSKLHLERVELNRGRSLLSLEQPTDIEFGHGFHVEDLVLLQNGVPRVRVSGGIDSTGASNLAAHIDSLEVTEYLGLFGLSALAGTLSGQGTLEGPGVRPVLDASIHGTLTAQGKPPAGLEGKLRWEEGTLDSHLRFAQSPEHELTFESQLPWSLVLPPAPGAGVNRGDASGSGALHADAVDLSWFEPLISPRAARKIRGFLNGQMEARGTLQNPTLSGSLRLSEAQVELPGLDTKFEDAEASVTFAGTSMTIERARMKSGKGRFDLKGNATLAPKGPPTIDLTATWKKFTTLDTRAAKLESSGQLSAKGSLSAPRVEGKIEITNSTFYAEAGELGRKVEAVELTAQDRQQLQERFGYGVGASPAPAAALFDSLTANVHLSIGKNVWVRRRSDPIVALEMSGGVDATKAPGEKLRAAGEVGIQTGRSYLSFLGRRFKMTRAQVELPGAIDSATVELEARYDPTGSNTSSDVQSVTAGVTMDARGVKVDLQSEPYMDRAALLNFLATGQTQGEMASGSAYGLAVGSVLGAVGGAAGRSLGFQVVQVTQDAYGGQTLSAGNYVDPRVYLGFRQPVVEGQKTSDRSQSGSYSTEFEIELEVAQKLLLNLQGGGTQYRFLLRPRLGR
jgi:translocation and assembly module TamB